ncbi:uncharacterized protein MCYG_01153 [Microsporum canis CBS 113480]|uniref:Uncharacterized protein n=1 Tax=Arthroderma otae (strain ATCC MYA-4605 / CBS 113480) TaxID=554155 RepID=C5FEX1_ARTOC|nr:uncharacterized protein MCYG_01153 [Microsporum canis CBS 113480]EEQ28265.1 predicted protein [Microsporum canis CBS 113480]
MSSKKLVPFAMLLLSFAGALCYGDISGEAVRPLLVGKRRRPRVPEKYISAVDGDDIRVALVRKLRLHVMDVELYYYTWTQEEYASQGGRTTQKLRALLSNQPYKNFVQRCIINIYKAGDTALTWSALTMAQF